METRKRIRRNGLRQKIQSYYIPHLIILRMIFLSETGCFFEVFAKKQRKHASVVSVSLWQATAQNCMGRINKKRSEVLLKG